MPSIKCKSCGAEVTGNALRCPACAAPVRKGWSPLPLMVAGLVLAVVIVVFFGR